MGKNPITSRFEKAKLDLNIKFMEENMRLILLACSIPFFFIHPVLGILIAVGIFIFTRPISAPINAAPDFIDQFQFSAAFILKYSQEFDEYSDAQRTMILDGLRQYFRMCRASPNKMVSMPSFAVDQAWHEFILFTREYKEFCNQAFGRYLHHTPAEAMESKEILQKGIQNAWQLACQDEKIDAESPKQLPKIFSIDASLAIAGGYIYSLENFRNIHNGEENLSGGGENVKSCGGCNGGGGGGCGGCGGGGCGG